MSVPALFVVTGFLGAGKTTLVREMVEAGLWRSPAVYVQEAAAEGLDQQLYGPGTSSVRVAAGGCGCCGELHELTAFLADDLLAVAAGRRQPAETLVFETSGLTDPCAILADLGRLRFVADRIGTPRVITVVDARHLARNLCEFDEARLQVGAADVVVLTRVRDAGDVDLLPLRQANPLATVIRDDHGDALRQLAEALRVPPVRDAGALQARTTVHRSDLRHATFQTDAPVDPELARATLDFLQRALGDRFVRMKALLRTSRPGVCISLHAVRGVIDPPREVAVGGAPDRPSTFVCFVRGIDPDAISDVWAAGIRLAASVEPEQRRLQ